jgi:hypothetical protein
MLLGTAVGAFWGIFALFFYTPYPTMKWGKLREWAGSIYILLFQFVFNFIGGFAGCIGLGLFLDRYTQNRLGFPELILLCISLLGVSGRLSVIIYRLPDTIDAAFKNYFSN